MAGWNRRTLSKSRRGFSTWIYILTAVGAACLGGALWYYFETAPAVERAAQPEEFRPIGDLELVSALPETTGYRSFLSEESASRTLPESLVRFRIASAIEAEGLNPDRFSIAIRGDAVAIEGTVPTLGARDRLELVLRELESVEKIYNHLDVLDYPQIQSPLRVQLPRQATDKSSGPTKN